MVLFLFFGTCLFCYSCLHLLIKNFPELYNKDALHRFVFGTYSDEKNVHCRPLTKLIRDIEKDMGVIIESF